MAALPPLFIAMSGRSPPIPRPWPLFPLPSIEASFDAVEVLVDRLQGLADVLVLVVELGFDGAQARGVVGGLRDREAAQGGQDRRQRGDQPPEDLQEQSAAIGGNFVGHELLTPIQ